MRQLSDDDYWRVVFPSKAAGDGGLGADALTCTGQPLFKEAPFAEAKPVRGWPIVPQTGDLLFAAGTKRMKIVWYKTHTTKDEKTVGPLALVRAEEDFAEVYGIGVYQGAEKSSRFSMERLGQVGVVTAVDDGCVGKAEGESCETWLHVYVPWHGTLTREASIATERRSQVVSGEPSTSGPVSYRLTAAPIFEAGKIRVLEQIQAVDSAGRNLRAAELERSLEYVDGHIVSRQNSMWDRMIGASAKADGAEAKGSTADTKSAKADGAEAKGSTADTKSAKADGAEVKGSTAKSKAATGAKEKGDATSP